MYYEFDIAKCVNFKSSANFLVFQNCRENYINKYCRMYYENSRDILDRDKLGAVGAAHCVLCPIEFQQYLINMDQAAHRES